MFKCSLSIGHCVQDYLSEFIAGSNGCGILFSYFHKACLLYDR